MPKHFAVIEYSEADYEASVAAVAESVAAAVATAGGELLSCS